MNFYNPAVIRCVSVTATGLDSKVEARLLPPGFRYLECAHTKKPIPEALAFLKQQCVTGRREWSIASANTSERYAYDLCDFLAYLDSQDKRIADIDDVTIDDWLDTMHGQLSARGTIYSSETIASRRSTVCSFALFAQDRGMLSARLPTLEKVVRGQARQVIALARRTIPIKPHDENVRPIPKRDLEEILDQLGTWQYDDEGIPLIAPRNRLIAELALQAGLRRAETVRVELKAIAALNLDGRPPLSLRTIPIFGKGNKWRNVPVPIWLLRAIQTYIDTVRASAVSRGANHPYLFVHEQGHQRAGEPISPKAVDVWFAKARNSVIAVSCADPNRCSRLARHTFHSLRHTFALTLYVARTLSGDTQPGKYVQAVLGHASQSTTDAIFLNASTVMQNEIAEQFQKEILLWAA